jgi:GNAT superfamily N-acetyltransferase
MGGGPVISKVDEHNVHHLLHLIEELARFEHLVPPDEQARQRLRRDVLESDPPFRAFLAYVDGSPVGYITYYFTYSTFQGKRLLFLEDIFVLLEARRKGAGEALFRFCLEEARAQGCARMEWTVLTWNERAIRFYEEMGGKRLDWSLYRIDGDDFERLLARK